MGIVKPCVMSINAQSWFLYECIRRDNFEQKSYKTITLLIFDLYYVKLILREAKEIDFKL